MTEPADNPRVVMGSNVYDPAEAMIDEIENALKPFKERVDALVADAEKRTVTDNDSVGRAADVRSMIVTLREAIEARAKEVALPHTRAVAVVRTRYERFVQPLEQADQVVMTKISTHREEQRARAAAQRDEQRRAEQALRAQQAAPVDPLPEVAEPVALPAVKGDYGSRVGDRGATTYVWEDPTKLPMEVLKAPAVEKAIQSALRAYAKLNPNIPGVTVQAGFTTSHRRAN